MSTLPSFQKPIAQAVRFRLVLALPLVLFCLTIATGWAILSYDELADQSSRYSRSHQLFATLIILGSGLVSALIGSLIALAITRPLRRLTALADRLSAGSASQTGEDEVSSLVLAFNRMMLSMDRFISDSYILGTLIVGVILVGRHRRILYANMAARNLLELPTMDEAQPPGTADTSLAVILPDIPNNRPVYQLIHDAFAGTLVRRREITATLRSVSGKDRNVIMTISLPSHTSPTDEPNVQLSFRNLQEREDVREEIRRADQLATVGFLASGLVHELRNPLGSIQGMAELLKDDLPSDHPSRTYCATILEATRRMERLINELLATVRSEREACSPVDVPEVIREAVSSIALDIADKQLRIIEDYPPDLPVIKARPGKLLHVFTNILANAVQASPPGEQITVTAVAQQGTVPGMIVRVNNRGPAIPPEQRTRIFLPFVTSKRGGTGLGLFIAQQFAQSQGGHITVDSSQDRGTTFEICLVSAA